MGSLPRQCKAATDHLQPHIHPQKQEYGNRAEEGDDGGGPEAREIDTVAERVPRRDLHAMPARREIERIAVVPLHPCERIRLCAVDVDRRRFPVDGDERA